MEDLEKNLFDTKALNGVRSYIGIDLRRVDVIDRITLCNLDFNFKITDDEVYLYFTVAESFNIYPKMVQLLGSECRKYLRVIYINTIPKLNSYHTVCSYTPEYVNKDGQLALFFPQIKNCFLKEDLSVILGDLSWSNANNIDVFNDIYPKLNVGISINDYLHFQDFIEELYYATVITDIEIVRKALKFIPF